jgi:hypothetical protein
MKLDLLTNASVVDDAIRFISARFKDKEKIESSGSESKEESNEPNYDQDKDQLENEHGRESWRNSNAQLINEHKSGILNLQR